MAVTIAPGDLLEKDPNEVLLFRFDWTDWLEGSATIQTSTFTIEGNDAVLTKDQESILSGSLKTQVRLSAGTLYQTYTIENKVVTNESPAQTGERSFKLEIVDR